MSKLKEIKSIFGIMIIVISAIFVLTIQLIYTQKPFGIPILIAYFITSIVLFIIQRKVKNKVLKIALAVPLIPYLIIYLILTLIVPTIILFIDFFIYFAFSMFIPLIYKSIDLYIYDFNYSKYTDLYLYITFSLMTILLFHKYILKVINYVNENNYGKHTNFEKFEISELANYVFDYKSLKFIIYTAYFIFLFIYSINIINGEHFLNDQKNEKVILQSFLSFIALDRLVSNTKDFTIVPSKLLFKLLNRFKD